MRFNTSEKADYVFAGAGASATLLLMKMEKHGMLDDKKILLLDPDEKTVNDKTYCFWSEKQQEPALSCSHLISHQWEQMNVNRIGNTETQSKLYHHITSLDLYNEQKRIESRYHITRISCRVDHLESAGPSVRIVTSAGTFYSDIVFDSRPPEFMEPKIDDVHLLQSFVGYVIETSTELTSNKVADLMDFHVEQQGSTQFMYVLPFRSNQLLVELTRFGRHVITEEEATPILQDYILSRFGNYRITATEKGCIPMSTIQIQSTPLTGVIPIGSKAGALKPSTGYAFKTMFFHAEAICASLKKNEQPRPVSKPIRFGFYDKLLLMILSEKPSWGKAIFENLFRKNSISNILDFLDEKSGIRQEISIFASLPWAPFLSALAKLCRLKIKKHASIMFLFFLTFTLLAVQYVIPGQFEKIQWILFAAGLILVGIPHGAVDHLLERQNIHGDITVGFVTSYLGLSAAYLLFWGISPTTALLFFVLYSAWHFGQTDMQDWKTAGFYSPANILWGICILSILCLGHLDETNQVLTQMHVYPVQMTQSVGLMIASLIGGIACLVALMKRNVQMLLGVAALLLSIALPLVTSFGLYFIGQHSIRGWSHLKKGMVTDNFSLFKKALPFTLGAIGLFCLLLLFYRWGTLTYPEDKWLGLFFIFISCISFPHVMAMSRFYRQSQSGK